MKIQGFRKSDGYSVNEVEEVEDDFDIQEYLSNFEYWMMTGNYRNLDEALRGYSLINDTLEIMCIDTGKILGSREYL